MPHIVLRSPDAPAHGRATAKRAFGFHLAAAYYQQHLPGSAASWVLLCSLTCHGLVGGNGSMDGAAAAGR
jgi:hypothetical protein